MSKRAALPNEPYRGLRYYEPRDHAIFAGRENDARVCANLLDRCEIVILHGRTGCGKSSFLRAALKPLLEYRGSGHTLRSTHDDASEGVEDLRVIRSSEAPLRALASEIWNLVEEIAAGNVNLGTIYSDPRACILDCKDEHAYRKLISSDHKNLLRSLGELALSVSAIPVFVIDQAEEVFTLNETDATSEEVDQEVKEYFLFLSKFAVRTIGVKLVISLRTEYKGQFDDCLEGVSEGRVIQNKIRGFFLNDLDRADLAAAVLRPTLTAVQLQKAGASKSTPVPHSKYRFTYAPGVVDKLLEHLTKLSPQGGILPTLQLICLRLYQQTRKEWQREIAELKTETGKKTDAKTLQDRGFTISDAHLRMLGSVESQVEIYLCEQLEVMFGRFAPGVKEVSSEIDRWYRLLWSTLVHVEPDGRTTTRKVTDDEIRLFNEHLECLFLNGSYPNQSPKNAVKMFSGRGTKQVICGLDWLATDQVAILRKDWSSNQTKWTLGHDSLGLALRRWHEIYGRSLDRPMKVEMNSPRFGGRFKAADLYGEHHAIKPQTVTIVDDVSWDHQLPNFAQSREFTERLGFRFVKDPILSLFGDQKRRSKTKNGKPIDEGEFTQRIHLRQEEAAEAGKYGTMLVAGGREWFPGPQNKGNSSVSESTRSSQTAWTDIAITNLFMGSALVGEPIQEISPLDESSVQTDLDKRLVEMREKLGMILAFLAERKATIWVINRSSATSTLKLAAQLCGWEHPDEILDSVNVRMVQWSPKQIAEASDASFERLLNRHGKGHFMIGAAFGRALARQSEFCTYFNSQHLSMLVKETASREPRVRPDIIQAFSKTFMHTIWHVDVPAQQWHVGSNRARVLRLASIAYFVADYVRSNPDDLVRFLYDWQNRITRGKGFRASRESIRETVRECYNFVAFDENSRLFFDNDSEFNYWVRDDPRFGQSVASDIFSELIRLREQTLRHFSSLESYATPLRTARSWNRMNDKIKKAETLKRLAWSNFRIYNFYDAERFMNLAQQEVQNHLDDR